MDEFILSQMEKLSSSREAEIDEACKNIENRLQELKITVSSPEGQEIKKLLQEKFDNHPYYRFTFEEPI